MPNVTKDRVEVSTKTGPIPGTQIDVLTVCTAVLTVCTGCLAVCTQVADPISVVLTSASIDRTCLAGTRKRAHGRYHFYDPKDPLLVHVCVFWDMAVCRFCGPGPYEIPVLWSA